MQSPVPRPPERRQYRPAKQPVSAAYVPVDRVLALLDGDVERLAHLAGRSVPTVYGWRRKEANGGRNGFFPAGVIPALAEALSARGFNLPEGFLSEAGVFDLTADDLVADLHEQGARA